MGKEPQRYRLKLSKLDFVSLVDDPAQPNAKTLLLKRRKGGTGIQATARYVKSSDELGLAFFWAFTSTNPDGSDHFDLHGDTIDEDFIKAAMDFMSDGGAVDEMHDSDATEARVVFAMPMTPEIAKAFDVETKTTGLMVALKVTEDQLAKLKDGTYAGVSIAGLGVREPVEARKGHSMTIEPSEEFRALLKAAAGRITDDIAAHKQSESPPADESLKLDSLTKDDVMDHTQELADLKALQAKLEEQIAELEAANVELKMEAELTEEERALLDAMSTGEAKRFRALDKSAKQAAVTKAREADPVVATFNGQEIRKSAGPTMIALAKAAQETADKLAARDAEIAKAEVSAITKEATSHLPGTSDVREYIVKSIRAGGGDAAMVDLALKSLRGADAIVGLASKAKGYGGTGRALGSPTQALDALVEKFATENKVPLVKARGEVMKTDEGLRLYAESSK